jgi:3-hydroxyisobutyrate dehydrogenase-like beta-hydroxyacid dehydrogenase
LFRGEQNVEGIRGGHVKPAIGFIGLGLMGKPMSMNLLKAGYAVTVWNRTASRADEVVAAGAQLAKSPREVAEHSDFLITIVSDPPALEEVLWGGASGGALSALKAEATYMDCSTVSPVLARKIADACRKQQVHFLDAPVTGGDWGAKKGELLFMIGGDAETVKAAEPILGVMGKKWFHLGPNGAGQTIKLAMNAILALQVEALTEAVALVTAAGLEAGKLVEVLQASMGRSGLLDVKAQNVLKNDYTPSFPLRLMLKDLGLALDLAKQVGVTLPATAAAHDTYAQVKNAAKEDLDYSGVMTFWKKTASA